MSTFPLPPLPVAAARPCEVGHPPHRAAESDPHPDPDHPSLEAPEWREGRRLSLWTDTEALAPHQAPGEQQAEEVEQGEGGT